MKVSIIINGIDVELPLKVFVKLVRLGCWFHSEHLQWSNIVNDKLINSQWYNSRFDEALNEN